MGIKNLINRYINIILFTLNKLLEILIKNYYNTAESKYIFEKLISTRQTFRRNILLLSDKPIFDIRTDDEIPEYYLILKIEILLFSKGIE
jgi:hypothetical protein